MEKKYNLLSMDPMYSPLHGKIADLLAKETYAVVSCLSKKVYLPKFKITLASSLIFKCEKKITAVEIEKIRLIPNYHQSYVNKIENRELNRSEIVYMAKFYLSLKEFILQNSIDLVVLHNDTRWYHAIAISICAELKIKYLVTEQGLIRPYTTVIDNKGANANANFKYSSLYAGSM
ncbi:MAG: phosphoribosylamine--glycine ligase, partial [Endozoicomonadaceae bacterium]|nr:phosphoribosylamine--glycine ligase [Endozoicomonadaceae bacterium]